MNEQDETNTTPRAGEGDTGEPGPSESAPGANGAGKAGPASNAAGSDAPGPNAAPAQPGVPLRREAKLPVNPKRVRGGVRLKRKEADPDAWTEQRVWRLVEQGADGDHLKEGLEYARNGQTRKITFNDGRVEASIQGRRPRAYVTRLSLPRFSPDDAARSIRSLGEQARFAAKLLAGELPTSIDDVFAPLGLSLFPSNADEFEITCSCKEEPRWCKHAVCAAALLAERMAEDPFLVFEMRGILKENLVEGLREQRSLGAACPGPKPVYAAHVSGLSDTPAPALEDEITHFWHARPGADMPSVPVEKPEVSHPLLRRLGPSPFQESRFPLVGLLATCYDLIGEEAIRSENDDDPDQPEPPNPPVDDADD